MTIYIHTLQKAIDHLPPPIHTSKAFTFSILS